MANTGNTTTLTFTSWITSTSDAAIETIDLPELSVEDIETTHLSTSGYRTKKPSDLATVGDLTFSMQFAGTWDHDLMSNTTATSSAEMVIGKTGTILITFPLGVGTYTTTAPKFGGTGYLKSIKPEEISNDSKMMATVTLAFDGVTGPEWTYPT